jgi:hypothetical protein
VVYGLGVLRTSLQFRLQRMGLINARLFTDVTEDRLPALTELDVLRLLVDGEGSG